MIAEALQFLRTQFVAAETPRTFANGHKLLICPSDGDPFELVDPEPPANFQASTYDSFVTAFNRFAGEGASIWLHDGTGVIGLLGDMYRESRVIWELLYSEAFSKLCGQRNVWHDQKAFVRLLQHDLAACGPDEPKRQLISAVRRLSFARKSDGAASVEHGKESLGRQVEAQVAGAESIPERISLTLPVYSTVGAGMIGQVDCGIYIDVESERFGLHPYPDQTTQAVFSVLKKISEKLAESVPYEECPIVLGKPDSE